MRYIVSPIVSNRCVTIVIGSEVLVVSFVMQDMPYGDEQFAGDCHEDFHFVLLADLGLMVRETTEETIFSTTCSPCTLNDSLA